jgi:peptidoglycan/LPS O-acetylase OafA/YrhL
MQFCCYFGLQKAGMVPYFAVIIVATHVIAFCSWHLIEKPAMSLKDWSPSAALRALRGWGGRPDAAAAEAGAEAARPGSPDVDPDPEPAMAGATPTDA